MTTEPISSSPPQPRRRGPGRKSLTPEALRETLSSVLQEQMVLVAAKVDEQIKEVQANVASLEQRVPNSQDIVDKVTAVLGPELSKQINQRLEGMALSPVAGASNGYRAASETPVAAPGGQPKLSDRLSDWTAIAGAMADVVLAKYKDYRQEARLDRQEARLDKMLDTNPVAIRDTMIASNSPMLPYWSMVFAPTSQATVEARIRESTDAVLIGMRARAEATRILREEQTRQRETPSPNSPSSSGSPTNTSTPSPTETFAPKSGGVSMNSKPRLPLHEVMG